MLRCGAVLSLALALLTAAPDPGSRLQPTVDGGWAVDVPQTAVEAERPGHVGVALRTRYAFVPPALLDAFFADHTDINTWSVGVEVSIPGPGRSRVLFGLDYTRLEAPPGNFRVGDSAFTRREDPEDASYTEIDLHALTVEVLFAWDVAFTETVGLEWALGLGMAWVPGTVTTRDVLPTCTEPVADCAHWQQTTAETHESPWPVYPLLVGQLGLWWAPLDALRFRADVAFRGVMYAGLTTETRF